MPDENTVIDSQMPQTPVAADPVSAPSDPMTSGSTEPFNMPSTSDSMASAPDPMASMTSSGADMPSSAMDEPMAPTSTAGSNLADIKSQALKQLEPLLDHLDQSPEEKFKAIMMMIQAQDNQDLIKDAYEAAQAITDEKIKAQALLDIISEVNYFSSHQS